MCLQNFVRCELRYFCRANNKELRECRDQIQMYQEMTAVKDQVVISLTNQVKYFPLHPGSFSYYTTISEGELNSGECAETRSVEVYI